MPVLGVHLAAFLASYRDALEALCALAERHAVAPSHVAHALDDAPFAMPAALRTVAGATALDARLRELAAQRTRIDDAAPTTIDAAMRAIIHDVLFSQKSVESTLEHPTAHPPSAPSPSASPASAPRAPLSSRRGLWSRLSHYFSPSGTPTRSVPPVMPQGTAAPRTAHPMPPPGAAPPSPAPPRPVPAAAAPPRRFEPPPPAPASAAPPMFDAPPAPAPAPAPVPARPAAPATSTAPTRWLSAAIDDHDPTDALALDTSYTVAIGVDVARRASAVGDAPFDDSMVFADDADEVELTVDLTGDDFAITALNDTFKVRRTGAGRTRARFEIRPRREGTFTLTAVVHKARNFVQHLPFNVVVGNVAALAPPLAEPITVARAQSSVPALKPRDVMLMLTPSATGGYDLTARDARGFKQAHLAVDKAELSAAIARARDALLTVVDYQGNGEGATLFQDAIAIDSAASDAALRTMARAGARLFQVLFQHPAGSDDAARVGAWLGALRGDNDTPLSIQVLSRDAPLPWGLLYTGDASTTTPLDWQQFLGFRHVIEQLPMVDQLGQGGATIASDTSGLDVSINLNRNIDRQMHATYVADQEQYWASAAVAHPGLRVAVRTTKADVLTALHSANTGDQLTYFYCHAETTAIDASGGNDASSLWLTDAELTLEELQLDAATSIKLAGNPLVFINACESAQLSPLFYGGFVPYFMQKGARGVIGTECRIPGIFAAEWAARFFPRFLRGEAIGPLFLALRREFLAQHNNPLGLLYAVYCDGDTAIAPSL